jgi:8-oxo-dGTP pyrophosphatase MutT (NUDIX family)
MNAKDTADAGMRGATVCILVRGDPPVEILLGFKKTGFAAGKINGIGGKIERGETAVAAATREVEEEICVKVEEGDLRNMGHLTFLFPARPQWDQIVYAFLASTWTGEPVETREMAPAWYPIDAIPFQRMWADNAHWLPRILAGERIRACYTYADDNETLERVELLPWPSTVD